MNIDGSGVPIFVEDGKLLSQYFFNQQGGTHMVQFKFIEGDCFKVKLPEDDFRALNILLSIPGGRHMKKGDYWKFPLSIRIYRQLKEKLGVSHPELDRELAQHLIQVHDNIEQSEPFGMHQHEAVHRSLKAFGFEHTCPSTLKICTRSKPLIPRGFALFMEMGTRKTSTAINIVDTLHANGFVKTCMVIVDLSIVDTWVNPDPAAGELARHSSIRHLTFTAAGSKKTKEAAINSFNTFPFKGMKWIVLNPETIGRIKTVGKKKEFVYTEGLEDAKPDFLIIDESTIIKNHAANRSKLIERLLYSAPYKIIMSGNAIPKGGHEVFGQYKVTDKGIYGDNFYKFRDKFFTIDFFNNVDKIIPEKKEEFEALFHSGCFVARKKDCLDLPPKTYEHRTYEMGKEQARAYKEMKVHAITAMEDLSCSAEVVITKYLRLSQIAGGYLPLEDENGKLKELRRFKEQPGLDAMMKDIWCLPNDEQFVIWARFQEEIEMISERLAAGGIANALFYGPTKTKDRIEAKRQFREKEIRAMILSSAGSKGLNDLKGATYVFYYSNNYSAETRQQSEDRNHRSGSKGEKITYTDYLARLDGKKTVDDDVLATLKSNKDFSDALLERKKQRKLAT